MTLDVGGRAPTSVRCRSVVNAAGLFAQSVACTLRRLPPATIPGCAYAKGHYFVLGGLSPFRHVHVTLEVAGRARFGPDVSWVDGVDYAFDEARAGTVYEAIRRYWRGLADGALEPGYTGIRPKLGPAGTAAQDPGDYVPAGQSLRHRIPRAHRLASHRGHGGGGDGRAVRSWQPKGRRRTR